MRGKRNSLTLMLTVENGSVTSENRRFLNKLGHTQASPIPQTPQMKLHLPYSQTETLRFLSSLSPTLSSHHFSTSNKLWITSQQCSLLAIFCHQHAPLKRVEIVFFFHWYIPTWSVCYIIKIYFSLAKENLIEVRKGTMSICKYQILVIAGTPKAGKISAKSKVSLEEPLPCSVNEYWQQTMNHQHDLHMK